MKWEEGQWSVVVYIWLSLVFWVWSSDVFSHSVCARGLIRASELCILIYKRFVGLEMHAAVHCGMKGGFLQPVRTELM